MDFNRVIIAGRLTRDVELRYLENGTAVVDVTLAINRKRRDQAGEMIEETDFVEVTSFGRVAEIVGQYCNRGSGLHVEGRLNYQKWVDKETGQNRSKLKVIGERVQLYGGKPTASERRTEAVGQDSDMEVAANYFTGNDEPPF